jgi:hypothetical protein
MATKLTGGLATAPGGCSLETLFVPFVIAIILFSGVVFFSGTRERWSKPPRKAAHFSAH